MFTDCCLLSHTVGQRGLWRLEAGGPRKPLVWNQQGNGTRAEGGVGRQKRAGEGEVEAGGRAVERLPDTGGGLIAGSCAREEKCLAGRPVLCCGPDPPAAPAL